MYKKKKVIISGFFGSGNIGDEIILEALINLLRKVEPALEISVFCKKESLTDIKKRFNVKTIPRGDSLIEFIKVLLVIKNYDILISGGGGLFQDWSVKTPFFYAGKIIAAHYFKKRIIIIGQSIGPLKRRISKFITNKALSYAHGISVRDYQSYNYVKKYIETKNKLLLKSSDLIFTNIPLVTQKSYIKDGFKTIGVVLRYWKYNDSILPKVNELLSCLKREYCYIFFPFRKGKDYEIAEKIGKFYKNSKIFLPRPGIKYIINQYKHFDILIGMRLHAILFSVAALVPFLALAYDLKIKNFCKKVGLSEFCIDFSCNSIISFKDLKNRMIFLKQNRINLIKKLYNVREQEQKLSLKNIEFLKELI